MKKFFIGISIGIGLLACQSNKTNEKEGDYQTTQKVYKGDIDEIQVSTSIDAEIIKGQQERVVLEGNEDDLKWVKVKLQNGKLHLYVDSEDKINFNFNREIKAKIYLKDYTTLVANSSGSIVIKDEFTQDKATLEISSSGEIKGDLKVTNCKIMASSSGGFDGHVSATNLTVKVSSSADVEISGKVKKADVSVSSSGDFDGKELSAKFADLEASSSGDLSISVSEKAKAEANSSGDIVIYKKSEHLVTLIEENSAGEVKIK
ncbi:MAG: DUF2807 domain-containing protein [Flavobacteriales bacterium]|nr:MAG: DUF2807 domain-containing protein [Flavobacteriales bacterium]